MPGELVPADRNELRASHEDRDMVVERLRVAAGDGRIDAEELDQRIEAALTARTYGELDLIVKDLPESAESTARAAMRRAEATESQAITVAHGTSSKYGPWLVAKQLVVTARHSSVVLDFTEAVFSGARDVEIQLDVRHTSVKLILPDGSLIENEVTDWRHSNLSHRNLGPAAQDAIRIRLTGRAEHSNIRTRRLSRRRRRIRERRAAIGR
jgi:hypothetical protein